MTVHTAPLLLLLAFLGLAPLAAQPTWMREVNLTKPGPHLPTRPIELTYDLSWNGRVSAGQATIRFGHPDPRYPRSYIAQSYGSTTGFARKLFQFDFNYTSFLRPASFRPQVFVAEEKTSDELKRTETRFERGRVKATEQKTDRKTGKVDTSNSSFTYPNALGVHAAVIWARSLDLKAGQEAVFVVMPFKTPYLCRLTHLGHEVVATRRTIKYDLKLHKIDKKTLQLKDYDKVKSLVLWISDDAERLPLEFRSEVFIGDVRAVLTSRRYP
ncbi:DUF3108 domain-containing protein [Roseibacillus ishigakijimensis]|uniref:DUF3108 domain-containing protein n=1 Tax=Roseibacillus ishigakijimensis TaxID=454146 RepID=A0A934RTR8_9BACT|nr:DUF3108 domain-containing protein [Roseibacillus ishigakijimensis]MBK1834351.1 DUF3108 domain-containing protein [Roseibacillus ishigakijimensis]